MLLHNAPQNEAIVSNVAEIGEFRIRNSAKAFNILSSGLYANKVRAIIRELSCNAVDSHVAAGKGDTPFDVHLPTQLEPWFAIRDYGTGLSHEQVVNIYTTYFESTKTNSNDFIGALGLGSKSPFSYTDNFTVTAIKDGVKGIYSAFINDAGIPSIAKMAEEESSDPAGVEVKFSVNDRWDFDKFYHEARQVYKWFKLQPVVAGPSNFAFDVVDYKEMDVIPGVHIYQNYRSSTAIMGNIAYPIEVPNVSDLGDVASLLSCGLVMEFGIGELDFQASREGLSYIPETVAAIKRKLEAVNAVLVDKVKAEADAYKNLWERAHFLVEKGDIRLYQAAVLKYATDTNNPLIQGNCGVRHQNIKFTVDDLRKKYNIVIRAFEKSRSNPVCSTLREYRDWGLSSNVNFWDVTVSKGTYFVVNDTKVGALERAKYHWREAAVSHKESAYHTVYVIEPDDRTKPIKETAFFRACSNPPKARILKASGLLKKERASSTGNGLAKNVTILKLEEKGYGGYHTSQEKVWRDAGKLDSFDANQTYYYLPLSGFQLVDVKSGITPSDWASLEKTGIPGMPKTVYGVRKADIEAVKLQTNWVNLQDHVASVVAKLTARDIQHVLLKYVDCPRPMQYNEDIMQQVDANSTYAKIVSEFQYTGKDGRYEKHMLAVILNKFNSPINVDVALGNLRENIGKLNEEYPILRHLSSATYKEVADYINLVNNSKGV